jgi:hypothetical protein
MGKQSISKFSNEGLHIILTKDKFRIVFDQVIKTNIGHVNGLELVPVPNVANVALERGIVVDINNFHKSIGHINEDSLHKMANYYGITLRGKLDTCFECSLAKIRQKNVGNEAEKTSKIPGKVYL